MMKIGNRIEERGLLVREGGRLLFRRELGGRMTIESSGGTDVAIGVSGRLIGTVVGNNVVVFERFIPDA